MTPHQTSPAVDVWWWCNESADRHKMVQSLNMVDQTSIIMIALGGPGQQGQMWTQHQWRNWFSKTDESHFEIYLLHGQTGCQAVWRKSTKIDILGLFLRIFNSLKKKERFPGIHCDRG
jgi:hypothetical protein